MTVNLAARYVHGEWTALVTGHGTALLDPSIGDEQVQQVWAALSEGRGVSGCLEVLAADGFANLPSFALVQHGEDELRVLVRGEVEVSAGESTVGAAGIATWREALLPGQSYRVEVAGDGAARPEWPLSGGVVLASRVEWLGSAEAASGAAAGAVATDEGDGSGDEAGDDGDSDPEPAGGLEAESAADADPEPESESVADDASAEAVDEVGVGVAAPVVAAAVAGSDDEAADLDDADDAENAGEDAEEHTDADHEDADPEDVGEAAGEASEGVDEFGDAAGEHPDEVPAEDAPSGDSAAEHGAGDEELAEEIPAAHSPQEAGEDFSADIPDEPSADSGEDAADAEHESAPHEPADPAADAWAHTAEEDSAPSPEEGDPDAAAEVESSDSVDDAESDADDTDAADDAEADADDDYAADAPTLTSSGSDIIDSLPWAVSASDREEARAVQDQAAAEPADAPAFEAPDAPGFDSPAEPAMPTDAVAPTEAAVPTAADDLPEQTVVSRADAQGPTPAPAQQPSAPAATDGEDDVISFDSLMAQQVPQHPSQEQHEQPEQPGAAFGAAAPAQPAAQPYQAAAAPYGQNFGAPTGGSGYAFGAPAHQQPTGQQPAGSQAPAPWAPPTDMAQAGGPPQGQGDVDIEGDHDGETIMVSQLPTDAGSGAAPGTGASDLYDEPHAAPAPSIHLALSTGAHVPLDRPVLIGRAPESARFNAGVQPRLVTVASPEQDISRTHVEMRAEGGHAVVTDLNSTNGTVVIQPGTPPRRLHPGEGASVPAGTVVDLGDGITVTVQGAAQGPG